MNENNKNIEKDSLSNFLNVVSVIQSQAAAVENISAASKTLTNIIKNINKFPNDLEGFNSAGVNSTLNGLSSAIKMLHSTNSDINKVLKDSIFNPIFFDNSIFKETERFADPSLVESIKNLAAQNGQTVDVNTFEKEKVNLYIENFLTTIKYTNQVFNAVKGFLNMCKSMNEVDPNNTGVSNVTSVFKKSLLSIKLIVGYISNIMDDPDMKNTLDYIARFQSEVNAYEGREAELLYLQEKMSNGKLNNDDSKRLNEHYKSKPTNIFECLTSLYGSILEILKSINQFNKLEPANPAALAFNLQLSIWNLNIVISMIPSILQRINTKELKKIAYGLSSRNIETIKSTTNSNDNTTQKSDITKTVVDQMTPFQLIQHIFNLIENLNNIKVVNPVKVKIALLSLQITFIWISNQILNIAASFKKMFNNKAKKDIIDGGKNAVESVTAITGSLAKIATDLETTAKKSLIALLYFPAILLFISTIKMITKVITGSFKNLNEDTKNTKQNINNVSITILDILKIGLIIIGIAALSAILLPATIVATLVVANIIIFVNLLKILLNNINIDARNIKTIIGVRKILLGIIKVGLLIIGIAVLGVVLLPATIVATLVIGGIVAFVYLLNILLKIVKVKVKDILSMLMLAVLLAIILLVTKLVLNISIVGSKINWIGLLNTMGALLATTAFAVLIGFAAGSILPVIGIATLGLVGIIVLIGLLTLTAMVINELQKIVLDEDRVKENIQKVINTAKYIIEAIFGVEEKSPEKSDKTWYSQLLDIAGDSFNKFKTIGDAILSVPFLLSTLISVGCIYLIANLLQNISNITINDVDSKIREIITAAKNISKIILSPVTDNVENPKADSKWDKFKNFVGNTGIGKFVNSTLDVMKNVGSAGVLASIIPSILMLSSVVDLIKSINELTIPKDINTKVNNIIDVAKSIGVIVSNKDGEIATVDENKVKQYGKFVDYSESYIKTINKLDVSKVKSLGDMYEKMGQFMEKLQDAPINDIADALVNKISPALGDINTSLNKKPTQTNQITQTTTPATTPVATQTTPNNPVTSNQPIKQIDYSGMLENIEDLLEQIKKKLNSQPQPAF